jgi:acyl-CoA synthetase (AMP-forming)/AMP-acid ligase II
MPNFHLGGSCVALQALYNGAKVSIIPSFESASALERIARDRVTILPLLPAALQMILDNPNLKSTDLTSLQKIMYFGSAIGGQTVRRAHELIGCDLVQHYGTTETWIITVLRPEDHDTAQPTRLASCGVAVPQVQVRVVDPAEEDVETGTVGQVLVKSPNTFSGYLRQPDATREVIRNGWCRTGDLGFLDRDGYLTLVDRTKDMIVSGAIRRSRARVAPPFRGRDCRGYRRSRSEMGRESHCLRGAYSGDQRNRGGSKAALSRISGGIQGAEGDLIRGRAANDRERQSP